MHEAQDEIDKVLSYISRFPETPPRWRGRPDRHVAHFDRFPFVMPYQIVGDEIIVLAD
ncbi:MAG: hypothetical protein KIT84_08630 [Labilithrix sp.]|nr:hypothetical protein [Labilithrix sp.]MCW5811064.1 hypothetical protein [Labilithrix sp.]